MNRLNAGNFRRGQSHKLADLGAKPSPAPISRKHSLSATLLCWFIAALCFLTILSVNGQVSLNRPPTGTWTNAGPLGGNIVVDGWLQFKETGGSRLRTGAVPDGYLLQRSGTNIVGVPGSGAIGDGNKGDIVVSGSGTNWVRTDSVKRYGATGNGVTNDRAAIQSAIDASYGSTLYVPSGNYLLSGIGDQLLLITNRVNIVGASDGSSVFLVSASVGAGTDVVRLYPESGVAMSHMRISDIQISNVSGTPARHGIVLDCTLMGMAYQTFERVNVLSQLGGSGFKLVNPTLTDGWFISTLRDCRFAGGIYLQRAGDNITIEHCNMYGNGWGIEASFVSGASSFHVEANNITSNPGMVKITGISGLNLIGNNFEWPQAGSTATNGSPMVDIVGLGDQVTTLNMHGNVLYAANIANTDGLHTTYVKLGSMVSGNNIQVTGTGVKWNEAYANYFDAETGAIGLGTTIPSTFGHFVIQADTNGELKSVIRNISSSTNASSELEFNILGNRWQIGMESSVNSNAFNFKFFDATKMTLLPSGYLGFGTTNPLDHVHIRSTVPTMLFQKPGAVSWTLGNKFDNVFSIYPDSGTSNALNITSEGRVAIGRTNATQLLHVGGTALFDSLIGFGGDVDNYYLFPPDAANGILGHSAYGWTLRGNTGAGVKVAAVDSVLEYDGVRPRERDLGPIANGGTVTFVGATNHYRATLSGATFNISSFPTVSSNTQQSIFLVYSNSSGVIQEGALPIALWNSGILTNGGSVNAVTNQIGESGTMVFTATGGAFVYVSKSEPRVSGGSDDQTAGEVPFTPTGTVAATDVQAAIAEVGSEKAPIASPTFTGTATIPTLAANATTLGSLVVTNGASAATLDTGQGANELYAMNQPVRTSDAVTFLAVTATGQNSAFGNTLINGNVALWADAASSLRLVNTSFSADADLRLRSLNATGNTTLGDAAGDTVTVNAGTLTLANDLAVTLSGGVNGINFATNTLSIDALNGRVGFGNATPAFRVEVGGGGAGSTSEILKINSGSTGQAGTFYYQNDVLKGLFGLSGGTDGIITGSALGDFAIRNSQRMLFSADSGTTIHMAIATTGGVSIGSKVDPGSTNLSVTGSVLANNLVGTNGVASKATDTAVSIATTGWTNTFGKNAVVMLEGVGVTYTIYNNAGTATYTNIATVVNATIPLQVSGKVIVTAGTGVSGTAFPW